MIDIHPKCNAYFYVNYLYVQSKSILINNDNEKVKYYFLTNYYLFSE
jgi:hypothetical protein